MKLTHSRSKSGYPLCVSFTTYSDGQNDWLELEIEMTTANPRQLLEEFPGEGYDQDVDVPPDVQGWRYRGHQSQWCGSEGVRGHLCEQSFGFMARLEM